MVGRKRSKLGHLDLVLATGREPDVNEQIKQQQQIRQFQELRSNSQPRRDGVSGNHADFRSGGDNRIALHQNLL
ncbi:unnamed protein product [Linum tenue]|uniref:Uncharacterized protein n=1 Tax=Linum tenue TaxID=586396 RepID=A0AAV0LTB5_9ROSI|nr:unnamed protein product [Linum tenue]